MEHAGDFSQFIKGLRHTRYLGETYSTWCFLSFSMQHAPLNTPVTDVTSPINKMNHEMSCGNMCQSQCKAKLMSRKEKKIFCKLKMLLNLFFKIFRGMNREDRSS